MIRVWIAIVYVNEQALMIHDDYVVHHIDVFPPIEPCTMCFILLGLANLNECPINEPNTSWQFLQMHL
jgi:hypothetical protein